MAVLYGNSFAVAGDSISYGFGDATVIANGAWRFHIAEPLEAFMRMPIAWRGTMQALGKASSGKKMLGTSGRRIDQILTTDDAEEALQLMSADMLAIHLGTNDMTQLNSGTWAFSVATSVANMSTLLDHYRAASPLGIAIVCLIMPNTVAGADALITQWNAAVQVMIAARSDAQYILTSDVNAAFKANATWATDYMYDGTHPNDVGEQVIASTIMSTISANVTLSPRFLARPRRTIIPHEAILRYTAGSTSLGNVELDTSEPWAISMDINIERCSHSITQANGIIALKTDQGLPFVFCTLPTAGKGGRGIEMGSSNNAIFPRMFASSSVNANVYGRFSEGWHNIIIRFDGVSRSTLSSYKLQIDGLDVTLASGSGLGSTAHVSEIGRVIAGGVAGTFDMANLTIWNGGNAMTAQQARDWFSSYEVPSGPTMIHRYKHDDKNGLQLTDSVGAEHGVISTATWQTSVRPTRSRAQAEPRASATARTQVSA